MSTDTEAPSQPRVRITSRCSTQDEFVAVYRQYCDQRSIFIATKTPKPRGTTLRFAVTLADGDPQIVGVGRIAESHADTENPYKRPGMRIEFIDLEDKSRALVHRLHAARRLAAAPPPPLPPGAVRAVPVVRPPAPTLGEGSEGADVSGFESDNETTDVRPPPLTGDPDPAADDGPDRAKGSELILPANPFGEVPDESLEGFVECTLYEEEGAVVLPPEEEVERQLKWLSPGALGTPPPGLVGGHDSESSDPVESALEQVESAIDRVRRRTIPPSFSTEDDTANPLDAILPRKRRMTTSIAPPMPVDERAQWKLLGIACGATAVLALAIGYFIWGGGPGTLVVNAAPNPPAAAPAAAPTPSQTEASAAGAATEGEDKTPSPTLEPPVATTSTVEDSTKPAKPAPPKPEPTKPVAKDDAAGDVLAEPSSDPAAPALNTGAPAGDCNAMIRSQPDGATVRLDGAMLGVTPLQTGVPCGSGLLKLARPRYESVEKRVELVNGANEMDIKLSRPIHSLTVTSFPAGAKATVNGKSVGRTPARTTVKGYERARIKITKRGYDTVSKAVYMKKTSSRVHSKLKRQSSSNRPTRTSTRPTPKATVRKTTAPKSRTVRKRR